MHNLVAICNNYIVQLTTICIHVATIHVQPLTCVAMYSTSMHLVSSYKGHFLIQVQMRVWYISSVSLCLPVRLVQVTHNNIVGLQVT